MNEKLGSLLGTTGRLTQEKVGTNIECRMNECKLGSLLGATGRLTQDKIETNISI